MSGRTADEPKITVNRDSSAFLTALSPGAECVLQPKVRASRLPLEPIIRESGMSCIAETADRVVAYLECDTGRTIRHRLDFDSPRTVEAAAQLGITFEDCAKKYAL